MLLRPSCLQPINPHLPSHFLPHLQSLNNPPPLSTLIPFLSMPRRASKETLFKNTMRGLSYPTPANPSHTPPPTTLPSRLLKKSLSMVTPSRPTPPKTPMAPASPSASILLISPSNRILLLHRVSNSSAFASAHVFPGGHVDAGDGELPAEGPGRHEDGEAYRKAGVRECFEESGILLARPLGSSVVDGADAPLLRISEEEREQGRKDVHAGTVRFDEWVQARGGRMDIEGLIPFTRWLTPGNLAKRYSTQMYLYFLPLSNSSSGGGQGEQDEDIHIPTPDGGVEHTAAAFKYAQEWIEMARRREIVLFPPQFFLLSLVADFLAPPSGTDGASAGEQQAGLQTQREKLKEWVEKDGDPPWLEKCISPDPIKREKGKWLIMGMGDPGPEVEGLGRKGDMERVLRVELDKETERGRERPRPMEVCWRKDLLRGDSKGKGKEAKM